MTLLYHDEKLRLAQHEVFEAVHAATKVKVIDCQPTGSAYYGKVAPADFDVLMWLEFLPGGGDLLDLIDALGKDGWQDCSWEGNTSGGDTDEDDYGEVWMAVRKGTTNAIITVDPAFFYRQFAASTMVRTIAAQQQRVPFKSDIIRMFQYVRDGEVSERDLTEGSNNEPT